MGNEQVEQYEQNDEFIYSNENYPNIDDLVNEYNNKSTSSEKLLILFDTKE
ncbi:23214_t:CDS:1, partial [Dentiscutata erythropus]